MKPAIGGWVLVLAVLGTGMVRAEGDRLTGNLNLVLAQKALDEDDWEPFDSQTGFGLQADAKMSSWPISLAVGFQKTSDTEDILAGVETEATTTEMDLGIKYILDKSGSVRPFIGGGITQIEAELEVTTPVGSASVSEKGTGFWLAGGLYWTLGEHFNLGAQAKLTQADVDFNDPDTGELLEVNAGGLSIGLLAGFHF